MISPVILGACMPIDFPSWGSVTSVISFVIPKHE